MGYANMSKEEIYLNMYYYGFNRNLNDSSYSVTTVVLIHELFHILGLYDKFHIYNQPDPNEPLLRRLWFGPNAIEGYKKILRKYGYAHIAHSVDCVPLEDDGGSSTAYVHIEENEWYTRNGINYPYLRNEIMTGSLHGNNHITSISSGALIDLGYTINDLSTYIKI